MTFKRYAKRHPIILAALAAGAAVVLLWVLPAHAIAQIGSTVPGGGLLVVDAPSGPVVTTTLTSWVDVPHMQGAIALDGAGDLAITFCAEVYVTNNDLLFVRALVDGVPSSPGEVVLAAGLTLDTRCFTFVKNNVGTGAHRIQMQWSVFYGIGTAHAGDRTLQVTYTQSNSDELRMLAVAAPSGSAQVTAAGWSDVPDVSGTIQLPASSDLAITFSAEAYVTGNASLFVRALVDGQPTDPSDAMLVVEGSLGTRTFTFVKQNLAPGSHEVRIQWSLNGTGQGGVNERTLKVAGIQRSGVEHTGRLMLAAPSGAPQTTTSTGWVNLPDMNGNIYVPAESDLAVNFSAEISASAGKRVFVRALVDGQPTRPSDVRLFSGGWRGAYAFTFVKQNVAPGNHTIQLQWSVDSDGQASAGDRTLAAYSFAKPNQAVWSPLPVLDSYTNAAISGHSDGRLYVAAITADGHMYSTSSDSPRGWAPWQSIGPEHSCPSFPCADPAHHFDPVTQPVIVRDAGALYLFARGTDDNLYETHRVGDNPWSDWRQLTTDRRVRGRLSVALTRSGGSSTVHVVYANQDNTVEYRRFGAGWVQVGTTEQWSNAVEGVIATDGVNEVWAVIRTNGPTLRIEKKNRPWSSPWHLAASRIASGDQGEFFDISNLVYFGGAYHVAYSSKHLRREPTYYHSLFHSRFRAGLPDDYHTQLIIDYTPQGGSHLQAELIVYRNKLVMAYRDEQGWVRYARWDNADPSTPWIGNGLVAGGRTSHRPAIGVLDRRPYLSTSDYAVPNFGNDLFAVANGFSDDRLSFINFSRAVFIREIEAQFDIYDSHSDKEERVCKDQDHPLAPTLIMDISKDGRPFFSELGYNLWVLPGWLSGHVFRDYARMGVENGDTSGRFEPPADQAKYPVLITGGPIGQCSGSWLPEQGDYRRAWEELGHGIFGLPFGFGDAPENNPPTARNAAVTGIALSDLLAGFEIFGRHVNGGRACTLGADANGRCRGFTGYGNNYDVGTRQHSTLYVHHYYSAGYGDQLRQWVQDDLANGQTLLKEKYNWGKAHIYRGIEFRNDAEPLIPLLNDKFATATLIPGAPFMWTEDTAAASSDAADPVIQCGGHRHGHTVWFRYTSPADGTVTASTSGSQYDTVLAAWTGQWGVLSPVKCHDNVSATDRTSIFTATVSAGVPMYFEVASYGGSAGGQLAFQLHAQAAPVYLPIVLR